MLLYYRYGTYKYGHAQRKIEENITAMWDVILLQCFQWICLLWNLWNVENVFRNSAHNCRCMRAVECLFHTLPCYGLKYDPMGLITCCSRRMFLKYYIFIAYKPLFSQENMDALQILFITSLSVLEPALAGV